MNWREQAVSSHYQTAVAIRDELRQGHVAEAAIGIEELIDALSRSERRALRSQLIRLMKHVLKWLAQPDQRSRSWAGSIRSARREIRDIQEETPSLTDDVIRSMWAACLEAARDEALTEMNQETDLPDLSWQDVFETNYRV
ncbi:MAG: DUF29 domain-containing protein [Planctomycetia bacterium]|nr:DUF29 domain-containing protein [Planctomycetia bacterium]